MDVLQAKNLTKKFGNLVAVDNVSFSLREGEILGFLGPNGAGKTTTIQILLGTLLPTSGEVFYFGKDFKRHREEILEQVNFSSTYTNLPWYLTLQENLNCISYLYDIKNRRERIQKVVELFHLDELLKKKTYEFSSGQLTRINLAKAFINFPKVILLDEPTASLDPDVAKYIREFLLKEQEQFQVSIILTSHNMAEIEAVCDRVIFINEGKIVADDTPENLAKSIETCHIQLFIKEGLERTVEYCVKYGYAAKIEGHYITVDLKEKSIAPFLQGLVEEGITYEEINIEKPTLEDYFLQVIATKSSGP
ncbi:MAG: ABC transporter ATP-binding protein [bacterium]|nr:ABC transporter ATP-binding protein [bacterium]